MKPSSALMLALGLHPAFLKAQVLAGDTTGLAHTTVDQLIASPFGPGFNGANSYLYMGVTGAMDLVLFAGNIHTTFSNGAWTQVNPTPSGMQVAASVPGGFFAKRLDSLDVVNASMSWIGFSELNGDGLLLASINEDPSDPSNWLGTGQWFEAEGDTTDGFLALRFLQATDTLYGWLKLTSYVTRDSSWLRIHDFAIDSSEVNNVNEPASSSRLIAYFDANGSLQIRGAEVGESMQVTVSDMAGRTLASHTAVCPVTLSIPADAQGLYLISVLREGKAQTLKLSRQY